MKKLYSIIIATTLIFCLSACDNNSSNENLQKTEFKADSLSHSIKASENLDEELEKIDIQGNENIELTEFALNLLKQCAKENKEKNTNSLISPISVFSALAMVENGAKAETLKQMETCLGIELDKTNKFFKLYNDNLAKDEKQKLKIANSIWINDVKRLKVNQSFLQKNKDYYDSDIFKIKFEENALAEINSWVKQKTDNMVPKILDKISKDAVIYLVNAVSFDADWEEKYEIERPLKADFMQEDYTTQKVELMPSDEHFYLENENSTGVIKYYKGEKYAFVALLPNMGITMDEYLDSLSGQKINDIIKNRSEEKVITYIPKLEIEYSLSLNESLINMGMKDAFNVNLADFTDMAISERGNIYINRVIHKTFIKIDEKGTKAAASTVVETADGCAIQEIKPKVVRLDRPFLYMIYDMENDLPVFMGTVMKIEN